MFQLSDPAQQTLLRIARDSVHSHLSGNTPKTPDLDSGELAELRAIFVSIHEKEALRGCVGNLSPTSPLYRTTSECAISAAVADPRFVPLTAAELPEVSFEISVHSPVEQVHDINQIEIGVHGLIVSQGRERGLLLPQVASEYRLDRERFLGETCRKAGLHYTAWKEGAAVYRFTAQIFSENS